MSSAEKEELELKEINEELVKMGQSADMDISDESSPESLYRLFYGYVAVDVNNLSKVLQSSNCSWSSQSGSYSHSRDNFSTFDCGKRPDGAIRNVSERSLFILRATTTTIGGGMNLFFDGMHFALLW